MQQHNPDSEYYDEDECEDDISIEENKQTNAMVHTTIVPTIVKAGIKDNVIPSIAKATFNSRILPGETSEDVVNFVKKTHLFHNSVFP